MVVRRRWWRLRHYVRIFHDPHSHTHTLLCFSPRSVMNKLCSFYCTTRVLVCVVKLLSIHMCGVPLNVSHYAGNVIRINTISFWSAQQVPLLSSLSLGSGMNNFYQGFLFWEMKVMRFPWLSVRPFWKLNSEKLKFLNKKKRSKNPKHTNFLPAKAFLRWIIQWASKRGECLTRFSAHCRTENECGDNLILCLLFN
jgi:hypothetical protein